MTIFLGSLFLIILLLLIFEYHYGQKLKARSMELDLLELNIIKREHELIDEKEKNALFQQELLDKQKQLNVDKTTLKNNIAIFQLNEQELAEKEEQIHKMNSEAAALKELMQHQKQKTMQFVKQVSLKMDHEHELLKQEKERLKQEKIKHESLLAELQEQEKRNKTDIQLIEKEMAELTYLKTMLKENKHELDIQAEEIMESRRLLVEEREQLKVEKRQLEATRKTLEFKDGNGM
ncbi:hypothetical protein JW960_24415 [candidate division KSB1 bacterium]|nr:hypothetical protein [candidate division KSB1 bacterium]